MSNEIDQKTEELLHSDNVAQLATVNIDNTPHIDTTWFKYAEDKIYLITPKTTKRIKNLNNNPNGYIVIVNKENSLDQIRLTVRLDSIDLDKNFIVSDEIAQTYIHMPFPQRSIDRYVIQLSITRLQHNIAGG